jgi:predicted Zn-dependent peptidase
VPLKHTVEEIVLKNGARGLIVHVPDATVVSYEINFRAGNQYSPSEEKQQTAHIMEHMVFGATKSIESSEEFSRQFTKNGAYYNAITSQRNMTYRAEAAYMEWDRILELQKKAICEPLFTEKILKTEKGNVREELVGQESSFNRLLWQRMYRDMGGPLLTDTEKKATIDDITLDDINEHHKRTHTTANMQFCLVGNLAPHRQHIIDMFETWPLPKGKELPIYSETLHSSSPRRVFRKDIPSSTVALHIVLNRELSLEEIVAMARLDHILTGSFHSRIFGAARSRGLSYSLYSDTDTGVEGTARWEIGGQVSVKNAPELYTLVAEQLVAVADGAIDTEELAEAKLYAMGLYQFKGQRVADICRWYASDYFEDFTIDPIDALPKHIEAVTTEQMAALAKEFLQTGIWSVGAVGTISESELKTIHKCLLPIFDGRVQ